MKFFIKPKKPFNFDLVGNLYSRFPVQCVDYYDKGIYERTLRIKNNIHLIKVISMGSVNEPKLSVKVLPDIDDKGTIKEKVKWILGTEDDIRGFYEIAKKDKRFAQIIKKLYGLRAPKTPTVFEAVIIAITEQQIALPVAISMRKRLVEKYGDTLKIGSKEYYAFPCVESLAKAKPEKIRELKFSMRKSHYIINVAKAVVNGIIDLEKMKKWDKQKILDVLTKIKGVGPWTVEYMMCRGMGRYDALPAGDLALRTALTKYLNEKQRISEKRTREFLESFGKYKGYAAFYLIYNYAFQKYPQERLLK